MFAKKKRRITSLLIVEDEPLVAFDTEYFLSESGYRIVATVESVEAALGHVHAESGVELILVDVSLPDGSGIDVARAAHAIGIPVLFVTGSCPGEARALAAGCLSKPYRQRDLIAAIEAIGAMLDGKTPKRLPPSFNLFLAAA